MALIHHKFNEADSPIPLLVDEDEELWAECVGDCLSNWMQNNSEFFGKQRVKMKTAALEPFMFAVKAFLPQSWLHILVQGGVLSSNRLSSLDALTEDEHYMLKIAEHMFNRCALLVENKNDIKTILNFIHDVEERPRTISGVVDISYAEKEVGDLPIFKSLWAPIRRIYDKKKSQAKICVIYFFKIIHFQIVGYGREGIDKLDYCKERFLRKQATLEGSFDSLLKSGGDAYRSGDNKEATKRYTQAAWRDPFSHAPFGNRAQSYIIQREFWNAFWDCRRALIRDPKSPKNWYRQARACMELDWLDDAIKWNDLALKHCVLEVEKVEIVKQRRQIDSHMKKRRENESESSIIESPPAKAQPVYNCQDSINVLSVVADACSLYDKGQYRLCVELWARALSVFHDLGIQRLQMSEDDHTMLKIVHALTLVKTGNYNNLMSAFDKFTVLESQSCKLVAVIYGFAQVYFKLNRFKEAFEHASSGLKELAKKKSRAAHECSWLAGCEMTVELTKEEMKKNLQRIKEESVYPPTPDALCRSHQDIHNPRLEIYLTDPDFKGLVQVRCTNECQVDFHLSCWKTIKATKHENRNDKMMLESPCPTPDCGGLVKSISVRKSAGEAAVEITSNIDHSPAPKPHKPSIKMKTENPLKLQKRAEKKLIRKQKKTEQKRKEEEEKTKVEIVEDKNKPHNLSANGKEPPTFYKGEATLLVKDDYDEILKSQGKNKSSKNKKKKEKELAPKQTLLPLDVKFRDEGRQLFGAEDFMEESVSSGAGILPMPGTAPMPIGNGLLTVPSSIPYPPDGLANTLFELFEDILRAHGPQSLGSAFLQDIMKDFPEEAHKKIISYGGIYNFIYSNKKFDIVAGHIICVREDIQRAQAMALYNNGGLASPMDNGGGPRLPGWPTTMMPGVLGYGPSSAIPPPRQHTPPPRQTFSWEQRARDMAAKLANTQSTHSKAALTGVVPHIKSSIIASDELPSLHEAASSSSSSTTSKRSRKKSSSAEKSQDIVTVASTSTTTTTPSTMIARKNSKDDDGFTVITRGGGKKTATSTDVDAVTIREQESTRITPSPSDGGGNKLSTKNSSLDSFTLSTKQSTSSQPSGKGSTGKSMPAVSTASKENQNDLGGEISKKKRKNNTSGSMADLDNFDMPSSGSSDSGNSKKKSSSAIEIENKNSGTDGKGKRKGKIQDVGVGSGSSSSNSNNDVMEEERGGRDSNCRSHYLVRGKEKVDGKDIVIINNDEDIDENDDAVSVMDSVDDIDDSARFDDLNELTREQLRQRLSGVGLMMEMLKQQQNQSSEKSPQSFKKDKPSQQPQILANLSSLLNSDGSGGGGGGIVINKPQRRESETPSPMSLTEDGSQSALRSDSPALSQGSSESSNQSQPPPLKPLKGLVGGMGILARGKKGKQRLPASTHSKLAPYNLLESQDNSMSADAVKKDSFQKADLEADLNKFIYQSSQPPTSLPSKQPEAVVNKENNMSNFILSGSGTGVDGLSNTGGIRSSLKMPDLHPELQLNDRGRGSRADDYENVSNENGIDPDVLQVFKQCNMEKNSSSLNYSALSAALNDYDNSIDKSVPQKPPGSFDINYQLNNSDEPFSSTVLSEDSVKETRLPTSANNGHSFGEFCSAKVDSIPAIGTGIMNMPPRAGKGFVTNGAGDIIPSPPTDFLNNEEAIKKLWCSSADNIDNEDKRTEGSYDDRNLIPASSLETLTISSSASLSPFPGLPSATLSSFTSPTIAAFPSLHSQSSSVPHIFGNDMIIPSGSEEKEKTNEAGTGHDDNSQIHSPFPSLFDQLPSLSSNYFLSSQFCTSSMAPARTTSSSTTSTSYFPSAFPSDNSATHSRSNPSLLNPNVSPYTPNISSGLLSSTLDNSTNERTPITDDSATPFSSLSNSTKTNFNPSAIPFEPSPFKQESNNHNQSSQFLNSIEENNNIDISQEHFIHSFISPSNQDVIQPIDNSHPPKDNPGTSLISDTKGLPLPLSSSSSLLSRLNPNSREFRPTSYSPTSDLQRNTTTSTLNSPCPEVIVTETSCQTDQVEKEVASVMINTSITCEMFEEMVEFIKQEGKRSQELKEELDRDKAQLKQSLAAECVLKQNLEETKEDLEAEKKKNKEMQEKLDQLKEEVIQLEGSNEDLKKANTGLTANVLVAERERNRAVTAEKKILQISSQLMGQKLESKKTEAGKHMAQLLTLCQSFASKGLPVPSALKNKQNEWEEFVVKCDQQLDILQDFFSQQLNQLNKGRILADLPEVSSKVAVPEMPKPPSSEDMALPTAVKGIGEGGIMPGAKGDNSKPVTPPPGLKPLSKSKQLPAPLQPRLLGGASNKLLQKLSQQLPHPSMLSSTSSSSSSSSSVPLGHQQQQQHSITPFDKIVTELQKSFPILSRDVLATFLEVVRRNNGGSFANMTVSQVVYSVRELVLGTPMSPPTDPTHQQASSFKMEDLPIITRPIRKEDDEDYENFCPICHEDMEPATTRTLDCNHRFHEECIRRWFQQQRSCPNCRVFSLLSDDYPSLK